MSFNYRGVFTTIKCHRLAYELWVEPIEEGLLVLHHCDNTRCVNPNHLYQGYQDENTADMIMRGRSKLLNGSEPMYLDLLPKMRELSAEGMTQKEIADILGIDQPTVSVYLRKY